MRKINVPSGQGGTSEFEEEPNTFCPHCGSKGLWNDTGSDDYYQGSPSWCLACGVLCYIGGMRDIKDERLAHLKRAVDEKT